MSWTEERVDRLRQLWGSGKSASEIAEMLGGVTRNAVIGKAHRLGLSGRPSPIKSREKAPLVAKACGATILNLTDRMCKWPIGDPKDKDFHFCGKAAIANLPYCAEHAALAYQPPASRTRRDETRGKIAG